MINTLKRLAIAVLAAFALIFVYGTLSMAWAGCGDPVPPAQHEGWSAIYLNNHGAWNPYDNKVYHTLSACQAAIAKDYGHVKCVSWAEGCDDSMPPEQIYPNHEVTEIYTLRITTNGDLVQDNADFATAEECEREGAYREYKGKIRSFTCIPGRGIRPEQSKPPTYTLWVWEYALDTPDWWGQVGLTYEDCIEARDHAHYRGDSLSKQEADPDMEAHRPVCLPDGRGHPRSAGR